MKRTQRAIQCSGTCEWFWDGPPNNTWHLVSNNCSAGCHCMQHPYAAPGTPAHYAFVQCAPNLRTHKRGERPTVRIRVTDDVDVCLFHVPGHAWKSRK